MNDQGSSIEQLKALCLFKEEDNLDELVNRLRKLRRIATVCESSCQEGGFHSHISHTIEMLLKRLALGLDDELHNLCLHIGCQFISNLAASNGDTCSFIWSTHNQDLKELFLNGSPKMKNTLGLLFINALNNCKDDFMKDVLGNESLFSKICEEATNGSECLTLFIERFLNSCDFHLIYDNIDKQCLCTLLLLIEDALASDSMKLSDIQIRFILDKFKFMSRHILNNSKEISPKEFQGILSIITKLSANEDSLPHLQNDMSFAIDCVYSLKAIHGCEQGGSVAVNSGVECYKRSLVRIIGNLCWECRAIQDLVRENNCIHVILECCGIDLQNPFINEWSVFAIRNLCKDNKANQEIIASIEPNADLTHLILGKQIPLS